MAKQHARLLVPVPPAFLSWPSCLRVVLSSWTSHGQEDPLLFSLNLRVASGAALSPCVAALEATCFLELM